MLAKVFIHAFAKCSSSRLRKQDTEIFVDMDTTDIML